MGFVVSLHFPQKFRTGQLGLLSINFNFRNIIFQPVISLCLGEVQNENLWEIVASSSSFFGPSWLRRSLAQIRELACRLRAYLFEAYLMGELIRERWLMDFWLTGKQPGGLQWPAPGFSWHRIYTHPRDISYFDMKSNFAGNVIKLSVNKVKWTGFSDATCTFVL